MDRKPVKSSLIRAIGYDLDQSILEVEFVGSGRVYRYFDFPLSIYRDLLGAESIGGYFNEHIRDDYPFEEDDPAP